MVSMSRFSMSSCGVVGAYIVFSGQSGSRLGIALFVSHSLLLDGCFGFSSFSKNQHGLVFFWLEQVLSEMRLSFIKVGLKNRSPS